MFDVLIALILLIAIIVSEVKDYKRKVAERRDREEERAIVRKIKADHIKEQNKKNKDHLDEEFREKYNVTLAK